VGRFGAMRHSRMCAIRQRLNCCAAVLGTLADHYKLATH
jgi:hypothetical protein